MRRRVDRAGISRRTPGGDREDARACPRARPGCAAGEPRDRRRPCARTTIAARSLWPLDPRAGPDRRGRKRRPARAFARRRARLRCARSRDGCGRTRPRRGARGTPGSRRRYGAAPRSSRSPEARMSVRARRPGRSRGRAHENRRPRPPSARRSAPFARIGGVCPRGRSGDGENARGSDQARPAVLESSTGSTPMRAIAFCHLASLSEPKTSSSSAGATSQPLA